MSETFDIWIMLHVTTDGESRDITFIYALSDGFIFDFLKTFLIKNKSLNEFFLMFFY